MRIAQRTLLILCLLLPTATFAAAPDAKLSARDKFVSNGLRHQIQTILLGGLAGGAFGLSTLSFYGRPQTQLANIPIGMAIGLIAGTIISTSQLVNNPQDYLSKNESPENLLGTRAALELQPTFSTSWAIHF